MSELPGDRVAGGAYQAFGDRTYDQLFGLFTSVLAELWTLRDRQRLTENVLERHGINIREIIENDHSTPEDLASMRVDRDAFIERVFATLAANVAASGDS